MNAQQVTGAMAAVTRAFWQQQPGRGRWFVYGGCLFWLVIVYLWIAWVLAKAAVWAVIEIVLACWLLVVLALVAPVRTAWRR